MELTKMEDTQILYDRVNTSLNGVFSAKDSQKCQKKEGFNDTQELSHEIMKNSNNSYKFMIFYKINFNNIKGWNKKSKKNY